MIHVQVSYTKETITKLEIKGHANFAEKGKDLVCAAVSAIITGGINAMLNCSSSFTYQLDEGYACVELKEENTNLQLILQIIIVQLETVASSYEKFIKIKKQYGGV